MYSYTTIIYLGQQKLNIESTKTFSPVIPLCLWPLLNKAACSSYLKALPLKDFPHLFYTEHLQQSIW